MPWGDFWLGFIAGRAGADNEPKRPLAYRPKQDAILGAVVAVLLVLVAAAVVGMFVYEFGPHH